jgi:hypothetical protein
MEGDISVFEGEVVRICEPQNEDWYVVENSLGEAGLCPGNHLEPTLEFSGKALFDIERLLTMKKEEPFCNKDDTKIHTTKPNIDESWKFFDPLVSPTKDDDEMLKLEAILEEKAKKANRALVFEQRPDIISSTEPPKRPSRTSGRTSGSRDIESLITNNLFKLRSLSPSSAEKVAKATRDGSNLTYDRLDVAKSVLVELNGKKGAVFLNSIKFFRFSQLLLIQYCIAERVAPVRPPVPEHQKKKAPLPPKPPSPKPRSLIRNPPRLPAPTTDDLMDLTTPPERPKLPPEPLYASVKKETQLLPPPSRPPRPHKMPSMELNTASEVQVDVQVHHYDDTPTNDLENDLGSKSCCDDDMESLYPSLPLRTSSILPRPALVAKGETFRSYINLKDLEPPSAFPPDKKSPTTLGPSEKPPKVASLPFPPHGGRSDSVASSIKSRSMFYASV